jgi:hypothetical protein
MNQVLEMLMNAAGGGAMQQVGQKFGLSEDQAGSAVSRLVPALLAGLQRNASQEGGMESLLGALNRGNHGQYLENPELLGQPATTEDGNSILGHIFGSKEVSRAVAGRAADQTGIGADILKQMLPVVATMVMGSLSKQNAVASPVQGPGAGGGGLLSSLLAQNRDGSIADDVVGMLGRFLGSR